MDNHIHIIKNSWNEWSVTWYERYRTDEAISKIIKHPESAFHPATYAMIKAEDGNFWVDESSDERGNRSKEELDKLCNWELNPLAAIPQWLSIHAVK